MIKKIVPAFAVIGLMLTATPSWAGCDGLSGKELKKCEKAAKRQAKMDAKTTPFIPSELDGSLKSFDEGNPFATDDYRSRVAEPLEIASVDAFAKSVASLHATVVFGRYLIDEVGKGNADAVAAVPTLVKLLKDVPAEGQKLVEEGKALPTKLQSELTGKDALKIPKATATITALVTTVTATLKEVPEVTKSVVALVKDPGAAAGAAMDAGTQMATEKVEGAVEDATGDMKEKVEGATGGGN